MSLTIENLLSAMIEERKKNKSDEDEEFVLVQQINNQWSNLFDCYFLSEKSRIPQTSSSSTSDDDLIFYVTRKMENDSQNSSNVVEVFRHHDVKRRPTLASPDYDWEETTNLNLVLHQFEYTVTTAVCIKTNSKHLQVLKRSSMRVYASPSRRDMNNKGTEEKITFPNIYFTVDNFEDKFSDMFVSEGQMVCVELVAKNPVLNKAKVLFLGSIKFEALEKVYENRTTPGTRVAQRVSLGMYTNRRLEFVRMRGPNGKGHAEMAIRRYQSGSSSPESSPTTPVMNHFDEENWNKRQTNENDSANRQVSSSSEQQNTSEVESTDIRQELSDNNPSGFLGRTLNTAINWVRSSNSRLNQLAQPLSLQACLTYLTLPCNSIVKDVLETNSLPLLTSE